MATATAAIPEFDNSYARLPESFYARQAPTAVAAPQLLAMNGPLAEALGFDPQAFDPEAWAGYFSGNKPLPGMDPIALAYAGHQFGNFVPQLGDGRAVLLGEVVDRTGARRDVQLKGAGRTPFSRGGDGRSALGPVLREYVVSEAMHALGIPTTRALAAVATGESVYREEALPGAILTRVASSHIRVGTFQFFAARRDWDAIRTLADYVIARHYPEVRDEAKPHLALLGAFAERLAGLVAHWLSVGFIHGVMNTDNMAIAGETIDYGPCAFMDEYDPNTVFSSIDHGGRYAYGQQPSIAQWNLARFAETLLPLIDADQEAAIRQATEVLEAFSDQFQASWLTLMGRKLGLEQGAEEGIIVQLLELMAASKADFTLSFRRLAESAEAEDPGLLDSLLPPDDARTQWLTAWQAALTKTDTPLREAGRIMKSTNPLYIPRNHQVENMIHAAVSAGDFAPFEALQAVLAEPFTERPELESYTQPPEAGERVYQTFCGT